MTKERLEELRRLASEIKKDVVRMAGVAHSVPFDASLSLSAFFVYLYWEQLRVSPEQPRRADRDRFVLGVEAASPLLYAALAKRGFFDRDELWHYRRLGALLQALPDFRRIPGIDAPCVTTGSALSLALAMAVELDKIKSNARVFCLVEESSLDSEDFAAELKRTALLKLRNLTLLVCASADLFKKGRARLAKLAQGWNIASADGSDLCDIEKAFALLDFKAEKPGALFVMTGGEPLPSIVAGEKHKKSMNAEDMDRALEELEGRGHER